MLNISAVIVSPTELEELVDVNPEVVVVETVEVDVVVSLKVVVEAGELVVVVSLMVVVDESLLDVEDCVTVVVVVVAVVVIGSSDEPFVGSSSNLTSTMLAFMSADTAFCSSFVVSGILYG